MKQSYIIIGIYVLALALSIFGFFIDSDVREASKILNIYEVVMLSVILFGLIMVPLLFLFFMYQLLKKAVNRLNI